MGPAESDILNPGYFGWLAPDELAYLRERLRSDPDLRYLWGFQRRRKTFPPYMVQMLAMWGDSESREANARIVRAAIRLRKVCMIDGSATGRFLNDPRVVEAVYAAVQPVRGSKHALFDASPLPEAA